ncbi:unnamed protein product, partial [Staurois parvus]
APDLAGRSSSNGGHGLSSRTSGPPGREAGVGPLRRGDWHRATRPEVSGRRDPQGGAATQSRGRAPGPPGGATGLGPSGGAAGAGP